MTATLGYDVATALWQGARPYQEDTLLADFHGGMARGFAVLADGMGGHAAGDLASRLVVIDAVSHLKFLMHDGVALEANLHAELTLAIETANDVLKDRSEGDARLHGMGTTFLATVMFEDRLYWASVGDSPLYLWRDGELRQLNADHSMAPVIDQMARTGEITPEQAANHPDRNALTSVLMGRALKAVDVPKTATVLDPGDVLIQASDGLQYLDEAAMAAVLRTPATSRDIADLLMARLRDLNDPAQDNTAVLVLQLTQSAQGGGPARAAAGAPTSVERAVGVNVSAAAPRAATPVDVARPVGGRKWLVPGAALGAAAVVAGLMFGLPNVQDTPELASLAPVADPPTVPLAAPVATVLPGALSAGSGATTGFGAGASVGSGIGSGVASSTGAAAASLSAVPATSSAATFAAPPGFPTKLAQSTAPTPASGATLLFDAETDAPGGADDTADGVSDIQTDATPIPAPAPEQTP